MDPIRTEDFRKNLYSFFIIRFFFLSALFFAFFLLPLINERLDIFSFRNKMLLVLIFAFLLLNFFSLLYNRVVRGSAIRAFAYLEFFVEVFFWVMVAYLSGGIESPYLYVVIIVIMYSGFILDEKGAIFTMITSFLLLLVMTFFIKSSVLPIISLEIIELYALNWGSFFSKLFIYLFFFAIAGLLATRVAHAIGRVNRELFERELRTQELKNHFYAIFSSLSMGIVVARERRIVFANDHAESICPQLGQFVETVLAAPYSYSDWRETHWEGKVLYHSVQQYVDNQEVVIFSDVTELRRREEDGRRREKMAAIGQLTASIAHEIKNPLASLIGASEVMFSSFQSVDDDARQLMEIIAREGERVKTLLDRLFVSTEERQLVLSEVEIRSLLEGIAKMFALSYPGIRIDITMEETALIGDPDRLREVFWNILLNSVEAMRQRGAITIDGTVENGSVILLFSDQGGGIPPEQISRIFDPFFSTKKRGTGLGLAVVHNVVKMHGGSVSVRNQTGGAQFCVTLPLVREETNGKNADTRR